MPKKDLSGTSTVGESPETALDTLNEELKAKRNPPRARRRRIEATIEARARKRRSSEEAVSSKFKTIPGASS